LSLEEPIRKIAAALDRPASTVSRELKRNSGVCDYRPAYAQDQARARRWTGARLERDASLRDLVLAKLLAGWSPEQVAGWLKRQPDAPALSHESIYRFIDRQIRRTKNYAWRLYLPRAKAKRGWRGRKGGSSASHIKDRVSIAERPLCAVDRAIAGHWEADLVLFSQYGHAALALHERQTRFLFLTRQPGKAAEPVARQIAQWLETVPQALRQTITFDNGTEFALHHAIKARLAIATYFCDTHSPWQKKAESKTLSAGCEDGCRAKPISNPSIRTSSPPAPTPTTTPRESALTSIPPLNSSPNSTNRCTSNVNPPSRLRGNDTTDRSKIIAL
jgi:transposase, IS30 family